MRHCSICGYPGSDDPDDGDLKKVRNRYICISCLEEKPDDLEDDRNG